MNYDLVKNLLFIKDRDNRVYKIINLDSILYAEEDYSADGFVNLFLKDKPINVPCNIEEFSRIIYAYKKGLEVLV